MCSLSSNQKTLIFVICLFSFALHNFSLSLPHSSSPPPSSIQKFQNFSSKKSRSWDLLVNHQIRRREFFVCSLARSLLSLLVIKKLDVILNCRTGPGVLLWCLCALTRQQDGEICTRALLHFPVPPVRRHSPWSNHEAHTIYHDKNLYRSRPEFLSLHSESKNILILSLSFHTPSVLSFLNKFSYVSHPSALLGWWQSNKFVSLQSFKRSRHLDFLHLSSFFQVLSSPANSDPLFLLPFVCSFVGLFHMSPRLIASLWSWLKRQRWRRH